MLDVSIGHLDDRVLVLNRYYAAIRVVSVRRALSLLYRRLAEVVHVEQDNRFESHDFESWRQLSDFMDIHQARRRQWVRCVKFDLAVPHVIRLLLYDRLPKMNVKFTRRNIYARDGSRCQYCGKKLPTGELSLDHVVPKVQGGRTTWENIVCACVKCNVRKGGRSPEQAGMKLITVPVKPKHPPAVTMQLTPDRFASWKQFINEAYWSVEIRE